MATTIYMPSSFPRFRNSSCKYLIRFIFQSLAFCIVIIITKNYLSILRYAEADRKTTTLAEENVILPSLRIDRTDSHFSAEDVSTANASYEQHWLYPSSLPSKLPSWVKNYVEWHRRVRSKYPGASLIQDPSAPPVLVRICLGLCGGLHDRLGQLPMDLFLANQTGRILLILWSRKSVPLPLEEFLIPPTWGIDWTFPKGVPGWTTISEIRSQPAVARYLEHGNLTSSLQAFFKRLSPSSNNSIAKERVVTFGVLGHLDEPILETYLLRSGEQDYNSIHAAPYFGNIFWTFFRPHPKVQEQLDLEMSRINLKTQHYTVVHCRVRHPKGHEYNNLEIVHGQGHGVTGPADKIGLPFVGPTREMAINIATHALECAATRLQAPQEPIYFMSDSNDLAHYMIHIQKQELQGNITTADINAANVASKLHVVSRNQTKRVMHIDRNKGGQVHEYYSVFVDLLVAIHARCVVYGIGFYARFAAKISGTPCRLIYAKEKWGGEHTDLIKNDDEFCSLKIS
jgi:hypothetical protein